MRFSFGPCEGPRAKRWGRVQRPRHFVQQSAEARKIQGPEASGPCIFRECVRGYGLAGSALPSKSWYLPRVPVPNIWVSSAWV